MSFAPACRAFALALGLLALIAPGPGDAAPADDLDAWRAASARFEADPHAERLRPELAAFNAWIRAATSHARNGQADAFALTAARIEAQEALIEASIELARTRVQRDRADDTVAALDNRIRDARAERARLEKHLQRHHKRGE